MTALAHPQELQVSLRTDNGHCIVYFSGALVASSIQVVQGIVDELGSLQCDRVVVDLTAVTTWDLVGQNVIRGLSNYLEGRGIRGHIREPHFSGIPAWPPQSD